MEKNKQNLQEDTFLKKHLQEIDLDKPKSNFTANIMNVLLVEEKHAVLKTEPLISKKMWLLSLGFIALCLWFLLKDKSESIFKFPAIDVSFLNEIQIPNIFSAITISNTILYAVIVFSLMIFVQIAYLKNHFDKRFD